MATSGPFSCFQCNTTVVYNSPSNAHGIVKVSCPQRICFNSWLSCITCHRRIAQRDRFIHGSTNEHIRNLALRLTPRHPISHTIQPPILSPKLSWDKSLRPPNLSKCTNLPPPSQKFFELETTLPGLGMRHLICRSFTGSTESALLLTNEEMSIHADLIKHCLDNSRQSNKRLARILSNVIPALLCQPSRPSIMPSEYHRGIISSLTDQSQCHFNDQQMQLIGKAITQQTNLAIADCDRVYDVFRVTRLPTSIAEIRNFYLEGKDAIIPNLPCPKARLLDDKLHAYVSPLQIISHYLAWGHGNLTHSGQSQRTPEQPVNCYHHSVNAKTIYKQLHSSYKNKPSVPSFPLIIFLQDWQDEFDKNNIIRNKSQIFLRTLSVLTQGKRGCLEKHTFIVAIGSKGDSRFTLDRVYNDDLMKIGQIHEAFDGHNQKNLSVMGILVASLEDRIERSGMCFTGQANHKFCTSFWHSTYLDQNSKLPSCNACFLARRRYLTATHNKEKYTDILAQCQSCADWHILCDNGCLDVPLNLLVDYPSSVYTGTPDPPKQRPVGPDVTKLQPMRLSFPILKAGACFAFYNYHQSCKQNRGVKWTIKKLDTYLNSMGLNIAFGKNLRKAAENNTELDASAAMDNFVAQVVPPTWERPNFGLSTHIEATFHCIFRGLIPDHVEICLASMKMVTKMKEVHGVMNGIMAGIQSLHLPRLPLWTFGKSNHTKLSMGGWQGSQEIAFSKVFVHILAHCRIHATRLPTVSRLFFKRTFDLLESATYAFYCTISLIMSDEVDEHLPNVITHYAKMYLSFLTKLEKISLVEKKNPVWARTGNHVSLLNVPEVMRQYGPVHTYFEAADESTIQWMKPSVRNVSTSTHSWKVTVLDAITRKQSLRLATEHLQRVSSSDRPVEVDEWKPNDFRIMKDLIELTTKFREGSPTTAVCISGQYPLLPYWSHDDPKKRIIKYRLAKEHIGTSSIHAKIRYSSFDKNLYEPRAGCLLPETLSGLRAEALAVYLMLPLVPVTLDALQTQIMIHMCGLTWYIVNEDSYVPKTPKW